MEPIKNLTRTSTATVAGDAASLLVTTPKSGRTGVQITNTSDIYRVFIRLVAKGASAPTVSDETTDYTIAPGVTALLPLGDSVDVYAQNDSGASTAITVNVTEIDGFIASGAVFSQGMAEESAPSQSTFATKNLAAAGNATVLSAPGAGYAYLLTGIQVNNQSATNDYMQIKYNAGSATVFMVLPNPANSGSVCNDMKVLLPENGSILMTTSQSVSQDCSVQVRILKV
jgi:hypothetical protein